MKRINLIGLAVVLICSLVFVSSAYANKPVHTLCVPTQYPTIQAAINAATPGDTVFVEPGNYNISATIQVDKTLTITSQGAEVTTLQVTTDNIEALVIEPGVANVVIERLSIVGADNINRYTAIKVSGSATGALIRNNKLVGCQGWLTPPYTPDKGIIITTSNPSGLFEVKNNIISQFTFGIKLGDTILYSSAEVKLVNNVIVENYAGISIPQMGLPEDVQVENCIIQNNAAQSIGISASWSGEPLVNYSNIADNIISNPGGISNSWTGVGAGNINEEPLFVDPANNNYHLQPRSPCIDAGDPNSVYNDPEDPRNPGTALYPSLGTIRNDMGAYGGPYVQ